MNDSRMILRRDFLKTNALAGGALLAGGVASGLIPNQRLSANDEATKRKLRILILGGTGFIGPWMAKFAVERGHHVTLFNRGRREKEHGAIDGIETLYGNRDPNLHAQTKVVNGKEQPDENSPKGLEELKGKTWDVVIDNSAYVPRVVKASAELLAPNVGQYLFISTVSVYADVSTPGLDETADLGTMSDPTNENVQRHYGPLKALCEQAAESVLKEKLTIVRPGFIVGPGDTTDRFTYWPVRTSLGGEILVPGSPGDPVQFIDVRDLADFVLRCLENRILGIFNATGPDKTQTVADVMTACLEASKKQGNQPETSFTYVPYKWLAANNTKLLPIFVSPEGAMAGFHRREVKKAVAAGLKFRNVEETCAATLDWWHQEIETRREQQASGQSASDAALSILPRTGLTQEAEAKLLAKFHDETK